MIDIESKVFDTVYTAVKTAYSGADVRGEYIDTPNSFPCVTIVEEDNYTYANSQDSSTSEHHANVSYAVNVYCDNLNGRKATAKAVANIVDEAMQGMMFTRTMKAQIPNQDRTIFRITMRYKAVVSEGVTSGTGQQTVTSYHIYRR